MKKFLILGLMIFSLSFQVEAASDTSRLDKYREILLSNSYLIEYENITPTRRVTNKDRVKLYGKNGLAVEENDLLANKNKKGVITANGQNKYEEVGGNIDDDGNEFYMCRLSKNGEDFFFSKYKTSNKKNPKYVGVRRNRVVANDKNYLAEILGSESYGDSDMSRLINAILPNANKNSQQAEYKFVAQGELSDNNFYEDYRAGDTEIVRYYFKGDELFKIASYTISENGTEGRRCIIRIDKFLDTPNEDLLQLPKGVKDVTKRKKIKEA